MNVYIYHRTARPLAGAACILTIAVACASYPRPRVEDRRAHRVVSVDRPMLATEFYETRRVFWVRLDGTARDVGGFTFALELDNQELPPDARDRERQLEFPQSDAKAYLFVSGERGRSNYSQKPSGTARLRQFADATLLSVDLEFETAERDPALKTPEYIFQEDATHLRITGTFTAR